MTTIKRHRHEGGYTIIPNAIFRDRRLSPEAKGLLCYLLSLPHDWVLKLSHVSRMLGHHGKSTLGRQKLDRMMFELVGAGYASRGAQLRRPNGFFGPFLYTVSDIPEPRGIDERWNRVDANPHAVKPNTGEDDTN